MAGADVPDTHPAFRERVLKLLGQGGHVQFEPSLDPTLIAFSALFASSRLAGFAANKQLRLDALTLVYDCWTESTRTPVPTRMPLERRTESFAMSSGTCRV